MSQMLEVGWLGRKGWVIMAGIWCACCVWRVASGVWCGYLVIH